MPPCDILDELAVALREKGFDIDETFQRAVTCSNEWSYDACRGCKLRDRFSPKFNRERTLALKWKGLHETLNPQPLAFYVIQKLLAWIDRVDHASQHRMPRPDFAAEDGTPIFPPEGTEEEYWWLTDVKKRAEEQKADEDGPPSSEEEDDEEPVAADALVTDSDPDSPRSDQEASQSQAVILPVLDTQPREPFVAWRK